MSERIWLTRSDGFNVMIDPPPSGYNKQGQANFGAPSLNEAIVIRDSFGFDFPFKDGRDPLTHIPYAFAPKWLQKAIMKGDIKPLCYYIDRLLPSTADDVWRPHISGSESKSDKDLILEGLKELRDGLAVLRKRVSNLEKK